MKAGLTKDERRTIHHSVHEKYDFLESVDQNILARKLNEFLDKADVTDPQTARCIVDLYRARLNAYPKESSTQSDVRSQEVPFDASELGLPKEQRLQILEKIREKRIKAETELKKTEEDRKLRAQLPAPGA